MIQRIFHPIGQGAFYSERHENFNIVYDCGRRHNSKTADTVITNAFKKEEVIDILFISHFDSDHVNKISVLKNHTLIKKVILPLLDDEQKNFLINLHRVLKKGINVLISDPKKFFGKETEIIYVKANETNTLSDDTNRKNIDELKNGDQISSGTILYTLSFPSMKTWVFIPYNHKSSVRSCILKQELVKKGFDVHKLKENAKYTLHEIVNDIGRNGKKSFNAIYKSLPKDGSDTCINENSMIVYSGIEKEHIGNIKCIYGIHSFILERTHRVSCIYTGDADLNVVNLKNIYSNYWEYIGTIQIPHHGATQNFNESVLDDKNYICPISAKQNNKHHPSSEVIGKIISQNSYPILISEYPKSEFIEEIIILDQI